MRGLSVVLALALLSACAAAAKPAKRSTKEWDKLDVNQLEKDWREGDDEWALENEYEYQKKVGEKRAKKMPAFDPANPQAFAAKPGRVASINNNHLNGPTMMFVDLKHRPDHLPPWSRGVVEELASKWKQLSQTGGLSINCYNLGASASETDPEGRPRYKIIVSLDKGWQAMEVVNFLRDRPETALVTWNGGTYWPTYQGEWNGEL